MKKTVFYVALCSMLIFTSAAAFAGLDDFAGTWKNINPDTGGITTLRIKVEGPEVKIHVWGKCTPKDCDWGEFTADAYGPSAVSNILADARVLTARLSTDFSKVIMVITRAGSDKLKAEVYTKFRDTSGRTNYASNYTFKRVQVRAVVPVKPPQLMKEDCISFNPDTIEVMRVRGRYKIVDGNHWLFDFSNKKNEADQALRIIKHYQMNQSCFVGLPDPSLGYMLISGSAPSGTVQGEDCISFKSDTIEVKQINGRWKIVDGSHWVFDFVENEAEAREAFTIIKRHGFNKSCYVGRPDPSLQYLRK